MTLTGLAITAFIVSLLVALIGFSGVAGRASGAAKFIAALFLVAAVMVLLMDAVGVNLPLETPAP
jgi:uncharacterized membrane protein YtjA (UPF0391 family)